MRSCPLCGKPMIEEDGWPGWLFCPDTYVVVNPNPPPYTRKCTGSYVSEEGVAAMEGELMKIIAERN